MAIDLESLITADELSDDARQQLYQALEQRNEPMYFNGVNGATGGYGLEPMSGAAFAEVIRGAQPMNTDERSECAARSNPGNRAHPIRPGNDPARLDQAGWAVVFSAKCNAAPYKEALKPLLDLRREQAGDRFRLCEGPNGYRQGEEKRDFFKRMKISEGPADPKQFPYYVLLVGDAEEIPYSFQYQLDVMRGVGRIHFETIEEYANYARSVVRAERGDVELPRKMSFFGVSNPDDKATEMSTRFLIKRLHELLAGKRESSDGAVWQLDAFLKDQATKDKLGHLLGGDERPALLFTASHGMEFPKGHPLQLRHQGALLCQDWPGPRRFREHQIPERFYFSGDDLAAQKNLHGMIAVFFACYGAGTPKLDQFARQAGKTSREEIAPHNFVARLPSKLLSHPSGGALAVIGHVERAWGYSFLSADSTAHTNSFEDTLRELMSSQRIGWATESLNLRYADKATELSGVLEEESYAESAKMNPYELAGLWTANNDARGYVIIGDPAVKAPLKGSTPVRAAERPAEVKTSAAAEAAPAHGAVVNFSAGTTSTTEPEEAANSAHKARLDSALAALSESAAARIECTAAALASGENVDLPKLFLLIELVKELRKGSA